MERLQAPCVMPMMITWNFNVAAGCIYGIQIPKTIGEYMYTSTRQMLTSWGEPEQGFKIMHCYAVQYVISL